jgi:hypothetical protein
MLADASVIVIYRANNRLILIPCQSTPRLESFTQQKLHIPTTTARPLLKLVTAHNLQGVVHEYFGVSTSEAAK